MAGKIWTQSTISLAGGGGSAPPDGLYLMSNEVPRADTVLIDDGRRGYWYNVNADAYDWRTLKPGWAGSVNSSANPIVPAGAIRNLAAIGKKADFMTSDYAFTSGVINDGDRNAALHNLYNPGGNGYAEVWVRCYVFTVPANFYGPGNPSADYLYGGQKSFTGNPYNVDGGIKWFGVGYNVGGDVESFGELMATNNSGPNDKLEQNLGNLIRQVAGNWYYIEFHVKLNSVGNVDGVLEMWINDLGPNGVQSGQSPIKRLSMTGLDFGRTSADNTALIGNLWLENWSNAQFSGSLGEELRTNLHVATGGPIGFVQAA